MRARTCLTGMLALACLLKIGGAPALAVDAKSGKVSAGSSCESLRRPVIRKLADMSKSAPASPADRHLAAENVRRASALLELQAYLACLDGQRRS